MQLEDSNEVRRQKARDGFMAWNIITFLYFAVALIATILVILEGGWRLWRIQWILEGSSGWTTESTGEEWPMMWIVSFIFLEASIGMFVMHWQHWYTWYTFGLKRGTTQEKESGYNPNVAEDHDRFKNLMFIGTFFSVGMIILACHLTNLNTVGNVLFTTVFVVVSNLCLATIGHTTRWPYYCSIVLFGWIPWLLTAVQIGRFPRTSYYATAFWVMFSFEVLRIPFFAIAARKKSWCHLLYSRIVSDHERDGTQELVRRIPNETDGNVVFAAFLGSKAFHYTVASIYFLLFVLAGVVFADGLSYGNTKGRVSNTLTIAAQDLNLLYPVGKIVFTTTPAIMMLVHLLLPMIDSCCRSNPQISRVAEWAAEDAGDRRVNGIFNNGRALAEAVFFLLVCGLSGISEYNEVTEVCALVFISGLMYSTLHGKKVADTSSAKGNKQELSHPAAILIVLFLQLLPYIYASIAVHRKPASVNNQQMFVDVLLGFRLLLMFVDLMVSYLFYGQEEAESMCGSSGKMTHGRRVVIGSTVTAMFFVTTISWAYGASLLVS
jgi:hypothetical protein